MASLWARIKALARRIEALGLEVMRQRNQIRRLQQKAKDLGL